MSAKGSEPVHVLPEFCVSCPACVWAAKDAEAAQGLRCRICLESFDEAWPVQSETNPDLCRRCASAAPSGGRGATHGRFNPLPAPVTGQDGSVGVTTPEKPGEDA